LETYAENTERLVASQTKVLEEERDRVDKLSAMFLPEEYVVQIRNGKTIEPVFYEKGFKLHFNAKCFFRNN